MNPTLRNIFAVMIGMLVGGGLNMAIIVLGSIVMPPPPGVDVNDIASINAHIREYSVLQLLAPLLAHALGTLVGAFLTALLAASRKLFLALVIGVIFLIGGIMAVRMIPDSPLWFDVLDLGAAYLPMAWIGAQFATRRS